MSWIWALPIGMMALMLLLWANLKLSVWLDRRRRGQEETTTDQS
jgi:hypothetical protein